jgi:hypothetical protein
VQARPASESFPKLGRTVSVAACGQKGGVYADLFLTFFAAAC